VTSFEDSEAGMAAAKAFFQAAVKNCLWDDDYTEEEKEDIISKAVQNCHYAEKGSSGYTIQIITAQ
jgi:hypothetical protein